MAINSRTIVRPLLTSILVARMF